MILLQIVICRVTMQLFLGAVPIILRLFSKARGHLLFSNYSRNNSPKPKQKTEEAEKVDASLKVASEHADFKIQASCMCATKICL